VKPEATASMKLELLGAQELARGEGVEGSGDMWAMGRQPRAVVVAEGKVMIVAGHGAVDVVHLCQFFKLVSVVSRTHEWVWPVEEEVEMDVEADMRQCVHDRVRDTMTSSLDMECFHFFIFGVLHSCALELLLFHDKSLPCMTFSLGLCTWLDF